MRNDEIVSAGQLRGAYVLLQLSNARSGIGQTRDASGREARHGLAAFQGIDEGCLIVLKELSSEPSVAVSEDQHGTVRNRLVEKLAASTVERRTKGQVLHPAISPRYAIAIQSLLVQAGEQERYTESEVGTDAEDRVREKILALR